jgi:predicted Zn-dependent protease with MMP-like domain
VRLPQREFDQLVERALLSIAPRFRKRLQNVVLVVESEAPEPGLLGLYQGRPLTERSVSEGFTMPDQITIFQRPHERLSSSLEDLERMVKDTVWHEIAHYFGMNEKQVRAAELRRARASVRARRLSESR